MFDNLKADFERQLRSIHWEFTPYNCVRLFFRFPAVWAVVNLRFKCWAKKHLFPIPVIGTLCYIPYRYLIDNFVWITTGIDIGATKIGKGLVITHGQGIVIGGSAQIGENCTLYHQVTIADNVKRIGNNVVICAGAKIIGSVKIGDNVIIGANAVVVKDIPKNTVAAGVPAKVLHKRRKRSK